MELMEDGNILDKVHILILRDTEYYTSNQSILRKDICLGRIGGKLNFPRYASFAATKIVLWWEEEYLSAYSINSGFFTAKKATKLDETNEDDSVIRKTSIPIQFVNSITKTAEQFLDHLHMLTQQALDHADLTVLTSTVGATTLLKIYLWYYLEKKHTEQLDSVYKVYRQYCDMEEALAERLLDLYCRLLSLYILQDSESLHWSSSKPFSEQERGSYVIQMWWIFMQGTKNDLWDSVPSTMAQQIFASLINESLTILSLRYTSISTSKARSQLLSVDISNLFLCVAQVLPYICTSSDEYLNLSISTNPILKDINHKCEQLFICLILRSSSLDVLHKTFNTGFEKQQLLSSKLCNLKPWIVFSLPTIFDKHPYEVKSMNDLNSNVHIILQLKTLLAQPQPAWSLLISLLKMNNFTVLKLLLQLSLRNSHEKEYVASKNKSCEEFLCDENCDCFHSESSLFLTKSNYYELCFAVTTIALQINDESCISEMVHNYISLNEKWTTQLNKKLVWNQKRSPWYEAIIQSVRHIMPTVMQILFDAHISGASMYQLMVLVLSCFDHLLSCINESVFRITKAIQDLISFDVVPIQRCVLLHILVTSLYTELLTYSKNKGISEDHASVKSHITFKDDLCTENMEDIALVISELLCSIDEDNKYSNEFNAIVTKINEISNRVTDNTQHCMFSKNIEPMTNYLTSNILQSALGRKCLKTIFHFIATHHTWLFAQLNMNVEHAHWRVQTYTKKMPLLYAMFHIDNQPFDQIMKGDWQPNWYKFCQTGIMTNKKMIWMQLLKKWEFQNGTSSPLKKCDSQIVSDIITTLNKVVFKD